MRVISLGQLVGQYIDGCQLEQLLSEGQVYATYRAQRLSSSRPVTFTLLSFPEEMSTQVRQRFRAQFLREAPTLVEMHHRHLVPLYGYGEWNDLPYLIMPLLPGVSLATRLERQGTCTTAEALTVLEQVTAGLEYAHCRGVVHGALMLSHLLVLRDQRIGIAGIGLLHLLQRYGMLPLATPYERVAAPTGLWPVDPKYLAPECVQQGWPADIRSDVYSVGLLLAGLLTGTLPLPGQVQELPFPRPLADVLRRALAVDPRERFRRVSDLLAAFAEELAQAEAVGASNQRVSSLFPAVGTPQLGDNTLLVSPSGPWAMSDTSAHLDAFQSASRLRPWQQLKQLPSRWCHGVRGRRLREPKTRRMSRRHVLSRLSRGAALGAFAASGVSIAYLTTTALMKLSASGSKGSSLPTVNAAQTFTNPRNGRQALLIHLPDGSLVAYDRACTHVGVYVNYDSKTHMLVCPAHEAIFDPAHGARVVQGPAAVPLPKVPIPKMSIQVRGDGTLLVRESGEAPPSNS